MCLHKLTHVNTYNTSTLHLRECLQHYLFGCFCFANGKNFEIKYISGNLPPFGTNADVNFSLPSARVAEARPGALSIAIMQHILGQRCRALSPWASLLIPLQVRFSFFLRDFRGICIFMPSVDNAGAGAPSQISRVPASDILSSYFSMRLKESGNFRIQMECKGSFSRVEIKERQIFANYFMDGQY